MFTKLWDALKPILLESLVTAVMAITLYRLIGNFWDWLWHGRWKTIIIDLKDNERITPLTAKENKRLKESPLELSKHLKGMSSPYVKWLNCDPLHEDAIKCGLYKKDYRRRAYIIDLRKNPKEPPGPNAT